MQPDMMDIATPDAAPEKAVGAEELPQMGAAAMPVVSPAENNSTGVIQNIKIFFKPLEDKLFSIRKSAISSLPAPVVNHSTKLIALLHIVAESLMLKSAGIKFLQPAEGKAVNYLTDPARNMYRAVRGLDRAANLQNQWQARATTSGIVGWAWGIAGREKKDTDESIRTDVKDAYEHPIKHKIYDFFDAFKVWDPKEKRKQIGMAVTVAGLCSLMSGFNNVNLKTQKRFTNPLHSIGGGITAIAGAMLWFSPTAQQGWERFGQAIWLRLFTMPFAIAKKINNHDRWGYYLAGQVAFQSAAVISFLLGGAEILPDGTVIDSKDKVTKAKEDYKANKPESKAEMVDATVVATALPSPQISQVKEASPAMPQLREAHHASADTAQSVLT